MTKSSALPASRRVWWTPTHAFYFGLSIAAVVPVAISLIDNPAGPYFAAYVSTAFVMFGLFEFGRRLKNRQRIGRIWAVLGAGIVTGLFVNMATILGPNIYLLFLVGQAMTVGLVLWLVRATATGDRGNARR